MESRFLLALRDAGGGGSPDNVLGRQIAADFGCSDNLQSSS